MATVYLIEYFAIYVNQRRILAVYMDWAVFPIVIKKSHYSFNRTLATNNAKSDLGGNENWKNRPTHKNKNGKYSMLIDINGDGLLGLHGLGGFSNCYKEVAL
jgi:hypothetical protein